MINRTDLRRMFNLAGQISSVLSSNLKHPSFKMSIHRMAGHCYSATEALYHLCGKKLGLHPYRVMVGDIAHWYLADEDNDIIIDITESQFTEYSKVVPYGKGCRKGFLTKKPSRRAQEIIRRVKVKL